MKTSKATSSTSSNEHQTTSNQVEVDTSLESTESVEVLQSTSSEAVNKDFENMVDDAVKTKPEKELEQKQVEKKEDKPYSPEEAAGVALTALNGVMGIVGKFTTAPLVVAQETQMVFAAMTTPLVMKYGKTIKGLMNPENVDLTSNVPEYLAIAALGVVAVPSYLQVKDHKKTLLQQEYLSRAAKKARETGEPQAVKTHGD